jgi:hypothetical protein
MAKVIRPYTSNCYNLFHLLPATKQKIHATNHLHTLAAKWQVQLFRRTLWPVVNTLNGVKIEQRQMERTAVLGIQQCADL